MNKVLLILILFALLFSIPGAVLAQERGELKLEAKADSLYDTFSEEKALDAYQKILEKEPGNYEALWKTSFLKSRIGNRKEKKDTKNEYFSEAQKLAERALQVDSADTQSHFVMSVAMGRKALISGAKERVAASRAIKKHVDRALAYDSTNAGAWHVLGRWHLKVANLNFMERLAANTLFGGLPDNASNEKAAEAIEKAIELNDKYTLYYHDLAMVYEEMGKKEQAIKACRTALDKENFTPDDPRLKEECRNWIEDWR